MGCQRASRLRAAHPVFLSRIPHSRRLTSVRPQARFLPVLDGGVPMDNSLEVPGVGQEALVLLRSAVPKDLRVGLMRMGGANGLRRHVFSRDGFSARAGLAGSQTPAFAIFTLHRSVPPESSPKKLLDYKTPLYKERGWRYLFSMRLVATPAMQPSRLSFAAI